MAVLENFLKSVVTQIINPLILLLSVGALVVFFWGVFEFVRNAGNATKREEGRRAIFWSIVGLVIIFGAYGIINTALGTFNINPIQKITQ